MNELDNENNIIKDISIDENICNTIDKINITEINDINFENKNLTNNKQKKKIINDDCQELKNIEYKTLLLNGTNLCPKLKTNNCSSTELETMISNDVQVKKNESWNKLDKTQKSLHINKFCLKLKLEYNLSQDEFNETLKYLNKCIERKFLNKAKDIIYDKENNQIINIPNFIFLNDTRKFYLKKDDKHVSTVKSLSDKKIKQQKTIKIIN
tara:strand:- start:6138 stop:6770 length:633 start_codon:yes stop_codon:yes gene_type:complete